MRSLINISLAIILSCNSQINTTHDSEVGSVEVCHETNKIEFDSIELCNENNSQKIKVINILKQIQKNDTLEILSDGKLTWRPFIIELTPSNLLLQYSQIFSVSKKDNVFTLRNEDSFIEILEREPVANAPNLAEYKYSTLSSFRLIYASIVDSNIVIQHGIMVNMNKKDFFNLIDYTGNINEINVVRNFDPSGDFIEQTYVFKDEKLTTIIMKSPY